MIARRIGNWYYELWAAWSLWRHRKIISLLREGHGLPRQSGWKISIAYFWSALAD